MANKKFRIISNTIKNDNYNPSSIINHNIDYLKKKSKKELIQLLVYHSFFSQSDIHVPLSLFCNDAPPLESLVKYLKEEKNLSIKEIAKRLNRNIQTIWTTYRNARTKRINYSYGFSVPLSIFSKEKYSILESLVGYLKEICNKKTSEIAKLLNRDIRVIHVHYTRYVLKKIKQNEKENPKKLEVKK